jgi:hypothetical protein
MCARFYEPQRVSHDSVFVTCYLLLLPSPLRQLDLMREKITPSQCVSQSEVSPQCPQALSRFLIPLIALRNFQIPIIVGITYEAGHTICAHFVLKINVGDGRSDIVRVKRFVRLNMTQFNAHMRFQQLQRLRLPVGLVATISGCVQNPPEVVCVAVRIQCDLLFYNC